MTLSEFNAWLEGYEASFSGAPTLEQWQTIKAKMATVVVAGGIPITPPYKQAGWPYDVDRVRYDAPATWVVPQWALGQVVC